MAFDEHLADRLREIVYREEGVREQKMFGGLAFLINGHMAVSASREGGLLLHVDAARTEALLSRQHARPMVMRGRQMDGWLRVDAQGLLTKRQLESWVKWGVEHAKSLPPKH